MQISVRFVNNWHYSVKQWHTLRLPLIWIYYLVFLVGAISVLFKWILEWLNFWAWNKFYHENSKLHKFAHWADLMLWKLQFWTFFLYNPLFGIEDCVSNQNLKVLYPPWSSVQGLIHNLRLQIFTNFNLSIYTAMQCLQLSSLWTTHPPDIVNLNCELPLGTQQSVWQLWFSLIQKVCQWNS